MLSCKVCLIAKIDLMKDGGKKSENIETRLGNNFKSIQEMLHTETEWL